VSCRGVGTVSSICIVLGASATGPVGIIVSSFVAKGADKLVSRFNESISAIDSHPSKGAIDMYLDHVTWKAS
jgi:hypothetical protein